MEPGQNSINTNRANTVRKHLVGHPKTKVQANFSEYKNLFGDCSILTLESTIGNIQTMSSLPKGHVSKNMTNFINCKLYLNHISKKK